MAKAAWDKLQHRYPGQAMVIKFGELNNLLKMKYENDKDVKDHIAHLKSQFSHLDAIESLFEGLVTMTILLFWLRYHPVFALSIASVYELKAERAT